MTLSAPIAFKPHFRPQVMGDDGVLLLSETGPRYLLRGRLYVRIAPLLDGTRTRDQIAEELSPGVPREKSQLALRTLIDKGYAEEVDNQLPRDQAAFWSGLGINPAIAAKALTGSSVAVTALGSAASETPSLITELTRLGVPITAANAALTVVIVEDYLQAGLDEINRRMRSEGRPWFLMKAVGQMLWLGPFFVPADPAGANPCWGCLARRLRCHRKKDSLAEPFNGGAHPIASVGALPSTRSLAVSMAATSIAKWFAASGASPASEIYTLDLKTMQLATHKLSRLDECEVCGKAPDNTDPAHAAEITLQPGPKRFKGDGGDRACSPEETWHRLSALISPITGIVPELTRADSPGGLPVYYVQQITPPCMTRKLGDLAFATGKGATELQAKISCLGEAVERYSGAFRGNERRIAARFSDLGAQAVHPAALQHFSPRQYAERHDWNSRNPGFHWVPEPFDETEIIDWTPNWSLVHNEVRWLPAYFCYYVANPEDGRFFCQGDSNGCASGNTREEAILQGFLELVERDSMALFWYNRASRPAFRLDSFSDPYFEQVPQWYARKNRTLTVLDLTTDLGIPVALAISAKQDGSEIILGLGAHLNAATAVSRALSELNQTEHQAQLWHRRGQTERSRTEQQEHEIALWFKNATLENQPWLIASDDRPREAADFPRLDSDDLLDDIRTCIEIVRSRNMDLIVMDMTRTDVGFPVVRVTVPQLRHFWKRLGPGRLYETPVALGWIPEKLSEHQLNPIPCFL